VLLFLIHRLTSAEDFVLQKGGNVVRLAGLYNEVTGPHSFWLRKSKEAAYVPAEAEGASLATRYVIQTPPNKLVSMVHYLDAARAIVALIDSPGKQHSTTLQFYYIGMLLLFSCLFAWFYYR
jgi:hypothetical protein